MSAAERTLALLEARPQAALAATPYHESTAPDGTVWTRFYRLGTGYLLRFPELADFEVSGDTLAVRCHPVPEATRETCEHLYLNQVAPLVLSRQDKLVFHASAVEVDGGAVAFLAESGRGKSTLAASFATGGARFLTDEGMVLEPGAGGYLVLPSHPSLRLWDDSRSALVAADAPVAPPVQFTAKSRILAGKRLGFCAQPRRLMRAYFLGDDVPTAAFERLRPAQALVEWLKNSFLLDPKEKPLLAAHFGKVADLANTVDCFRLAYPRRFEELPRVRRAIIAHLQEEGVAA